MGIFDKAKDALSEHSEHVGTGIDKAGDFVDGRTEGKYAEHVDKAQELAKERLRDRPAGEPEPPA